MGPSGGPLEGLLTRKLRRVNERDWKLLPVGGAVAGGVVGALLGKKAHAALVLLAVALASALVLLVVLLIAAWGWEA